MGNWSWLEVMRSKFNADSQNQLPSGKLENSNQTGRAYENFAQDPTVSVGPL